MISEENPDLQILSNNSFVLTMLIRLVYFDRGGLSHCTVDRGAKLGCLQ